MSLYQVYETKNTRFIKDILSDHEIKDFMFSKPEDLEKFLSLETIYNEKLHIYCMTVDHKKAGISLFAKDGDEHWVDVAFLKQYRGKDAHRLAKMNLEEYIDKYSPAKLKAKIRKDNLRSVIFSSWLNFKKIGHDDQYYYVEYQGWVRR